MNLDLQRIGFALDTLRNMRETPSELNDIYVKDLLGNTPNADLPKPVANACNKLIALVMFEQANPEVDTTRKKGYIYYKFEGKTYELNCSELEYAYKKNRRLFQSAATYIAKKLQVASKDLGLGKLVAKRIKKLEAELQAGAMKGASESGKGDRPSADFGVRIDSYYQKALEVFESLSVVFRQKINIQEENYAKFLPNIWVNPTNPIPMSRTKAYIDRVVKPLIVVDADPNYKHGDICSSVYAAASENGYETFLSTKLNTDMERIEAALAAGQKVLMAGSGCTFNSKETLAYPNLFWATVFKKNSDCGCSTLKVGGVDCDRIIRF